MRFILISFVLSSLFAANTSFANLCKDTVTNEYPAGERYLSLPPAADFSARYSGYEMMDNPEISPEALMKQYRQFLIVNKVLKINKPTLNRVKKILLNWKGDSPIRILDIGSGFGDLLRAIDTMAQKMKVDVELIGVDMNSYAIKAAQEATPHNRIRFTNMDVFKMDKAEKFDLVLMTNMLHHLKNEEIAKLFKWSSSHSTRWIASDLYRNRVTYNLFWTFTRILPIFTTEILTDGLLSIRRAFIPEDWDVLLNDAGVDSDLVNITRHGPGRAFSVSYDSSKP